MILTTERLIIREIGINDAKNIFIYRSDKEENKYQGWIPKNLNDVYNFINNISKIINIPNTWFQFGILTKNDNKFIGDIGIHFLDKENKQVEIGCTLNKIYQEKGYATESLKEIINFLFSNLNKHRIIGSIDPRNTNSIKLLERLGFRKEAHFKQSIFDNGKWVDDIIYAILKNEWNNQ